MATKTLNLKSSGVYVRGTNIESYDTNKFTTTKVGGKGTAKLNILLDLETIFGTINIPINGITIKYKAVSNRSLSTYKQGTVRSGYITSADGASTQVYEYVESTAKEGKTPTSYSDAFSSEQCNKGFWYNLPDEQRSPYMIAFYISLYNPGSFNLQVFFTEVSIVIDYTVPTYTCKVSASPEEGGTVTGGGTCELGGSFTITATPNEGYTFTHWLWDGSAILTSPTFTLGGVTASHEFVAYFEKTAINNIWVNTVQPKAIYYDSENIVFVVDGTIPTAAASIFDTVDGFHIKVQNTVPSGMTEVKEVYRDTVKVYG